MKAIANMKSDSEQKHEIGVTVECWLALSVSSTHGLIAQLVGASERWSMVIDSNPTQANFL